MKDNPTISELIQKFCTPGHSSIQELDNIHSHIEKRLRTCEVYSPISLFRNLKTVRWKNLMRVIQLQKHNFFDFSI